MFEKFLKENKGKMIWVATSAGLFSGTYVTLNPETIVLQKAFFFSADAKWFVGDSTIAMKNIFSWGMGFPTFQKN